MTNPLFVVGTFVFMMGAGFLLAVVAHTGGVIEALPVLFILMCLYTIGVVDNYQR